MLTGYHTLLMLLARHLEKYCLLFLSIISEMLRARDCFFFGGS